MIDRAVCDREFPYRWRSSVAVFSYEPPAEYQEYDGQIVSYLKVIGTVTGYQPDPEEVGLSERRVDSYWNDPGLIENYKDIVSDYYGCFGAILEVAVAPPAGYDGCDDEPGDGGDTDGGDGNGDGGNGGSDDGDGGVIVEAHQEGEQEELGQEAQAEEAVPVSAYPYFVDFEPKKREVYETVTETGEQMSRSLENVNVRKGTTTTDTHEVLDVFGGFNVGVETQQGGGELGVQGQWGTRDIDKEERTDVRTTDRARELRESYSHTTQLTQMYHQLTSYHLGTNRAVFYMLPRPHVVQAEETFVNGPRLLEGIQEFMLVVMRPDDMCPPGVEAYLETAHIASEPNFEHETDTASLTLHVEAPCVDTGGGFGDDSNTTEAETSETYRPPAGWEVDVGRNGGAEITSKSGERVRETGFTAIERDHVTIHGKVDTRFEDRGWGQDNACHEGWLDLQATVYIRKTEPTVSDYDQNLWLTGRGVCCGCERPSRSIDLSDAVTLEVTLDDTVAAPVGSDAQMSVREANRLRADIGRTLVRGVNHVDRYPYGSRSFAETEFLSRTVSKLVWQSDHPDNEDVTEIEGLAPEVREAVAAHAPGVSRGRLLRAPMAELADRFELDHDQARQLRRAALGLEGPLPPRRDRWDPPSRRNGTDEGDVDIE
ncbi:hypothetical protein [Halosimplex amylolyticum]|uniref:hypothetical protein n=1 Tax=Halosimplex amylolyticum TaxID=3396616 RepID=UPI003F5599C9